MARKLSQGGQQGNPCVRKAPGGGPVLEQTMAAVRLVGAFDPDWVG